MRRVLTEHKRKYLCLLADVASKLDCLVSCEDVYGRKSAVFPAKV
jgi:hypothetical protein